MLLTYFVHPGTAFYIGYNSDLQNLNRSLVWVREATCCVRRATFSTTGGRFS